MPSAKKKTQFRLNVRTFILLTLPPNMDFLLLLRALLCDGEAGIPPDNLAGCDRLDCEGEEGIGHGFIDEETER